MPPHAGDHNGIAGFQGCLNGVRERLLKARKTGEIRISEVNHADGLTGGCEVERAYIEVRQLCRGQ